MISVYHGSLLNICSPEYQQSPIPHASIGAPSRPVCGARTCRTCPNTAEPGSRRQGRRSRRASGCLDAGGSAVGYQPGMCASRGVVRPLALLPRQSTGRQLSDGKAHSGELQKFARPDQSRNYAGSSCISFLSCSMIALLSLLQENELTGELTRISIASTEPAETDLAAKRTEIWRFDFQSGNIASSYSSAALCIPSFAENSHAPADLMQFPIISFAYSIALLT